MNIRDQIAAARALADAAECGTVFERKTDLGKALELLAKAEVFFKSSTDITINTYGADIAKFMDRMREKGHI